MRKRWVKWKIKIESLQGRHLLGASLRRLGAPSFAPAVGRKGRAAINFRDASDDRTTKWSSPPVTELSALVVHWAVPMQPLNLKPTHKLVKDYYQALGQFGQLNIGHEMAVRDAFQDFLKGVAASLTGSSFLSNRSVVPS